jgi:hypothetical protein
MRRLFEPSADRRLAGRRPLFKSGDRQGSGGGRLVFEANGMAVASLVSPRRMPRLDAPATLERVAMAIERLRAEAER